MFKAPRYSAEATVRLSAADVLPHHPRPLRYAQRVRSLLRTTLSARARCAAWAMLVGAVSACGCNDGVDVEAERVYAVTNTTFRLLVHAEDPITVTPNWHATPAGVLHLAAATATESTVVVETTGQGSAELSVKLGKLGDGKAELLVGDPPTIAAASRPLLASHVSGSRPAVAVVKDRGGGGCNDYRVIAFAGAAPMGQDLQPCQGFGGAPTGGDVALFETGSAAQILTWPVTPGPLMVPTGGPPRVVTVDLLGHDALGAVVWKEWWVHAQELFALNRVGVRLDSTTPSPAVTSVAVTSVAVQGCSSLSTFPRPTLLFVDEARDHLGNLVRGFWCGGKQAVVISLTVGSPSEIPHELAHAFGVHLHMGSSIDPLNLMTPHGSDASASARTRFTIGQVFTMNFTKQPSLLAELRPAAERRSCPSDCPLLVLDVPRGR